MKSIHSKCLPNTLLSLITFDLMPLFCVSAPFVWCPSVMVPAGGAHSVFLSPTPTGVTCNVIIYQKVQKVHND